MREAARDASWSWRDLFCDDVASTVRLVPAEENAAAAPGTGPQIIPPDGWACGDLCSPASFCGDGGESEVKYMQVRRKPGDALGPPKAIAYTVFASPSADRTVKQQNGSARDAAGGVSAGFMSMLEDFTGLDLDGDGVIGAPHHAQVPNFVRPDAERMKQMQRDQDANRRELCHLIVVMERKAQEYARKCQFWGQKEDTLRMRCMDQLDKKEGDRLCGGDLVRDLTLDHRALLYDAHTELRQIAKVRQYHEALAQNMEADLAEARNLRDVKIYAGAAHNEEARRTSIRLAKMVSRLRRCKELEEHFDDHPGGARFRSASPKFEGRATRSPSPGFEASVRKRSASPKFEGRATRSSSPGFEASVRKRSASPRVRHGGRPGKGRSFSPVLDVGARKRSQSPHVQDKRPETVEEQPSGSSKQRRPEGEGDAAAARGDKHRTRRRDLSPIHRTALEIWEDTLEQHAGAQKPRRSPRQKRLPWVPPWQRPPPEPDTTREIILDNGQSFVMDRDENGFVPTDSSGHIAANQTWTYKHLPGDLLVPHTRPHETQFNEHVAALEQTQYETERDRVQEFLQHADPPVRQQQGTYGNKIWSLATPDAVPLHRNMRSAAAISKFWCAERRDQDGNRTFIDEEDTLQTVFLSSQEGQELEKQRFAQSLSRSDRQEASKRCLQNTIREMRADPHITRYAKPTAPDSNLRNAQILQLAEARQKAARQQQVK